MHWQTSRVGSTGRNADRKELSLREDKIAQRKRQRKYTRYRALPGASAGTQGSEWLWKGRGSEASTSRYVVLLELSQPACFSQTRRAAANRALGTTRVANTANKVVPRSRAQLRLLRSIETDELKAAPAPVCPFIHHHVDRPEDSVRISLRACRMSHRQESLCWIYADCY